MSERMRFAAFTGPKKLIILWCMMLLLPLSMSSAVDLRPALGFNLGLSYGTAVAHLANGTVVEIAKVEGSKSYQNFLHFQLRKKQDHDLDTSHGEIKRDDLLRRIQEYTGIGGPDGATILAEMLVSLRRASEDVLGQQLPATVAITVPYINAWQYQECGLRSYVETARVKAGLELVPVEDLAARYLSEVNTIVAAHGQALCPNRFCNGEERAVEPSSMRQWIYYVSFTNHSLHTSFQAMSCFFYNPGSYLADSRPELGLEQLEHEDSKEDLWRRLQEHLVSQHKKFVGRQDLSTLPILVVVAGEGANAPKFVAVINETIARIQADPAHWYKKAKKPPEVEVLVADDPVFAAAKGAALHQRFMMDSSYCEDFFKVQREYRAPYLDEFDYDYLRDEL